MYTEFLHCNACFTYSSSPKEDQIRFWLTECGHVVCESCLSKHGEASRDISSNAMEHTCSVCNTKCATIELTDKLSPNLGAFFRSAHEMLDEVADVMRFQKTNTTSLIEFLKDKLGKQRQMLDKAKNELLQYKDMKNELQNLKEENRRLKSQLQEARPSTPVKRPIESPIKPNTSPRKLHKSPAQNHNLDISPSQRQPRTPNPPKRLSLPTSPMFFKQQSQQDYYNYSSQYEYQNNNQLPYNCQTSWNDSVGNYDGYDGGSGASRYDTRAMPPPSNECYSVPLSESIYNKYPQKISNATFSRPGTAPSTRMTWNELRNTARNDVLKMKVKDPGSRVLVAAPASKYQLQPHSTSSNYTAPTSFRSVPRNFQSSSNSLIAPQPLPRTPIMRNREALPGLNNRRW
ncbi:hypothetical protein C1645_780361 [Glomus cerebriforme]|uniref:RING-type domain-containing protein n=1 Tax=Glomus cerebriforme TaxID=658196 RepID=A0A397SMJ3_9GLOM|nr:hypothetical protein C1645_780361 [Glomus cerebriforme]